MWPSVPSDRVDRAGRLFAQAAPNQSRYHRILTGHQKGVDGLAWNSNGTRLASTSRDATVRVWSIDTRKDLAQQTIECMELKGHTKDVEKCAWNPNNPGQ